MYKKSLMWKDSVVIPEWEATDIGPTHSSHNIKHEEDQSYCILKDREYFSKPASDFDAFRFIQYQEMKYRLFAAERLERIRRGTLDPTKEIEDELILQEMISMYGEMDQKSERFKILFKNYKECYLEQIEECKANEEKIFNKILQYKISIIDENFDGKTEIQKEIEWKFKKQDIERFEVLSPWMSSGKDCLSLPRPHKKWEKQTLEKFQEMAAEDIAKVGLNLNIFDPKYCNFPKWTVQDENHRIGPKLCEGLNILIHEFPCGITPDVFWERFYTKHNYRIDIKNNNLGLMALNDIFFQLKDIFYIVKNTHDNRTLLFPASFQGQIASIEVICTRLRHLIMHVLSISEGYMLVEDILDVIYKLTGVKFNSYDWGFQSVLEFVDSYTKLNQDAVSIESIKIEDHATVIIEYYLVIKSPCYMETFQMHKAKFEKSETPQKIACKRMSIPPEFMQHWNTFEYCTDQIEAGQTHRALLSAVNTPSRFYLCLLVNWSSLDKFQQYIQNDPWTPASVSNKEVPQNMTKGLFVLFNTDKIPGEREWYRGQIIDCLDDNKYRVRMLDYGSEVVERFDQLKYHHLDLQSEMPAQAVLCRLKLPQRFDKYKKVKCWTLEHKQIFRDLLKGGHVWAKFHSKHLDPRTKTNRWDVTLTMVQVNTNNIVTPNVAQAYESVLLEKGLESGDPSEFKHITEIWTTYFE